MVPGMEKGFPAGRVPPDAGGVQPVLGWFGDDEWGGRRWSAWVLFQAGGSIQGVSEQTGVSRRVLDNWRALWKEWWGEGCVPGYPFKPRVSLEEAEALLAIPDPKVEVESFVTDEGKLLSDAGLRGVQFFVEWLDHQDSETREGWRPEQAVRVAKAGTDLLKAAVEIEDRPLRRRGSAGATVNNTLIVADHQGGTVADQLGVALEAWRVQTQ